MWVMKWVTGNLCKNNKAVAKALFFFSYTLLSLYYLIIIIIALHRFLVLTFQGYFNTLRMEVNEHDIGVTLVCPGPVQTDVVANAFTEDVNKVHDTYPVCSTLNKHL